MHYMEFIAQEMREYMAQLGVRTVDELVGRTDLLKIREDLQAPHVGKIELENLLAAGKDGGNPVHFEQAEVYDFGLQNTKDIQVLEKQL